MNAREKKVTTARVFIGDVGTRAHTHLVLLLIGLLDEGAGDLMELTERRDDPDGLSAALLGGLWRHMSTPHNSMNHNNKNNFKKMQTQSCRGQKQATIILF